MTEPTTVTPRLVLDFGGDDDNPCGLCGNDVDGPSDDFGVAIHNGPRVCQNCAHKHEPGAWQLAEGLDYIEHALRWANPKHRPGMVATVISSIGRMAEQYRAAAQASGAERQKSEHADDARVVAEKLGVPVDTVLDMTAAQLVDLVHSRAKKERGATP